MNNDIEDPALEQDVSETPALVLKADFSEPNSIVSISEYSAVPALFGAEDIFSRSILPYLSADDLCRLAVCSKHCHRVSLQKHLWDRLTKIDFNEDAENILHGDTSYKHESVFGDYIPVEKNKYKHLTNRICGKIRRSKEDRLRLEIEARSEKGMEVVQKCLDLTQFRLLVVLPSLVVFVTLILFAVRYDGAKFSTWYCFLPLFVLLGYLVMSTLLSWFIFTRQGVVGSPFQSYWNKMQSPINILFENYLKQNKKAKLFFCFLYFFVAAQLVLLGIKMTSDIPIMDTSSYDWGIVFIPLWILFSMYFCVPVVWRHVNGLYFILFALLWLPFLILCICVAIKLNNADGKDGKILRLELILIPFWIIEGILLLGSVVYLFFSYRRFTMGQLDRMEEPIGITVVVWIGLLPFILVQTFLSVLDHGENAREKSGITVAGALSPLMVVAALVVILSVFSVFKEKTNFEVQPISILACSLFLFLGVFIESICCFALYVVLIQIRRAERQNETAGTAVIFNI